GWVATDVAVGRTCCRSDWRAARGDGQRTIYEVPPRNDPGDLQSRPRRPRRDREGPAGRRTRRCTSGALAPASERPEVPRLGSLQDDEPRSVRVLCAPDG